MLSQCWKFGIFVKKQNKTQRTGIQNSESNTLDSYVSTSEAGKGLTYSKVKKKKEEEWGKWGERERRPGVFFLFSNLWNWGLNTEPHACWAGVPPK
jgi:hypothetical protein